jgi:glutamate carboxypeptidase
VSSEADTVTFERQLAADLPGLLHQIERIVDIDSGSATAAGVDAVHEVLAEDLRAAGFAVRRHAVAGHGDCLEATLELGAGPSVVVLGHADTVWPQGTGAAWPFARNDGWIDGPGVGDMKAALVMASAALRAVAARDDLGWGRMTFLVTPDELRGSAASRPLLERFASGTDVCLTLEGVQSGGGMVVARGAVGAVTLTAHGRTAHCTEPGGASVIAELTELLPRIEALSDPAAGTLVSVGVIRAGTARQVVPDLAEVEIDVRGVTAEVAQGVVDRLQALADGPRRVAGVHVELSGGLTRPAFGTDRSDALYALATRAAAHLGLPSRAIRERGGSDGSFFGALGVLTLDGLGPYCENSCSRRERVEIASIPQRGAVLMALLACIPETVLG